MKDAYYFSHDYNVRSDIKIKRLIAKHGYEGYGIFWAIVEDLYNNANALPTDCESIAYDLRTTPFLVKSVIHDFDLFDISDGKFSSNSIERRLKHREKKSINARESANKRWHKNDADANAMRTQCEGNAIKERKGNEIKEIQEEDGKYELHYCKLIALKDTTWYEKAKLTEKQIDRFIEYLISTGEHKKNILDFKRHCTNWNRKVKENNPPERKLAELR